jgi:hypothetical protein
MRTIIYLSAVFSLINKKLIKAGFLIRACFPNGAKTRRVKTKKLESVLSFSYPLIINSSLPSEKKPSHFKTERLG